MSFSFGTPSSAPATTGTGGNSFNFGATKPATPGFGSTAGAQPSTGLFNTPATSAPSFGSTAPAFGTATTSAFGSATPSFGTTSAAPTFSTATTPAFGSLPNFGSSGTPAFGATSTAPTFGGATSTAPTFGTSSGFGLSFGAATTSTTTSAGLGGLGGIGFGTSTSTQNSNLLFGGTSTATTATSIFGAKLGTTNVTGTQPTVSATASFGLGGVAPVGGTAVVNAAGVKTEPPKQQKLPNEISTTLDSFKEFVKKQKAVSSEMMRVSIKPLHKVAREAEITLRATLSLCGEVCRARAHSRRLRAAAAAALAAADHAARDSLVQGMELESNAPPGYVKELLSELEQQLITFRRQMDVAAKQMQSSPKLLTEQELTLGIRRMHESLVALAGRLQAVHSQVEAQKEQYLNLRKYILKDPTNVFDSLDAGSSLDQILKDTETSRKKIKSGNLSDVSFNSAVFSDPRVTLGNIQQLAGPTPFPPTYLGNSLSSYPTTDASGPGWQPAPQSQLNTSMNPTSSAEPALQLHKPPGKRGKQSY